MNLLIKKRICFAGLILSLLIVTLLIIFSVGNPPENNLLPPNTFLPKNPSQALIPTEYGTLYLPKDFSFEKEYPLFVIFHGLGGHHTSTLTKYKWPSYADRHQLILFSVRPHLETWYYDDDSPDLKNTQQIVKQLKRELPIKKEHTAIYGFSAGAHYVNYLILHNSRLQKKQWFDVFIQISGGSCVELDRYIKKGSIPYHIKASKTPGYMVWGEREVPPPGKKSAQFLIAQGWDITTHPHDGLHYVPKGEMELAIEWFFEKTDN